MAAAAMAERLRKARRLMAGWIIVRFILVFPEEQVTSARQVPFGYLNVRFLMVPEKWLGEL